MKLTEIEIAYLAGLFDGEGTFTISKMKSIKYPEYYFAEIFLTNSSLPIMRWLSSKIDGKICITRYANTDKNWKDVYKFNIHAKDKMDFVTSLLPYLRIKLSQAQIVLELLNLHAAQKASKRGSGGLSDAEKDQRRELALAIRAYNKRGVEKSKDVERLSEETLRK